MSQRKRQRERDQQHRQRRTRRDQEQPTYEERFGGADADTRERREALNAASGRPEHTRAQGRYETRERQAGYAAQHDAGRRSGPVHGGRGNPMNRRDHAPGRKGGGRSSSNGERTAERPPRGNVRKESPPPSPIVKNIAQALGENQRSSIAQIRRIVKQMGEDFAEETLEQAWQIEQNGGMLVSDGSRRRTVGGVFFLLVKERLLADERIDDLQTIFPNWKPGKGSEQPPTPEPAPEPAVSLPVATWAERINLLDATDGEVGDVRSVKVTLVGKLSAPVERQGFTLATLEYQGPLPALPKGMPAPDAVPTVKYLVYIGSKQWNRVKGALRNPDDSAIIEGTQIYDAETQAIVVFATNFTTRLIEQEKREQKKAEAEAAAVAP